MQSLKPAVLSAALFAALAVSAGAAQSASTTPESRAQVAAKPQSPSTAPGTWMPAAPSTTTATSGADTEGSYSRKGFGPNPDCSSSTIC